MTNRATPLNPPTNPAMLAVALLFAALLSASLFTFASAQEKNKPSTPSIREFPSAWKNIAHNITPFSIDAAILMGSENQTLKPFAHLYIEFPDTQHIFQSASFNEPFPYEYKSFSTGGVAVIHDLKTDAFAFVPSKIVPVSIFSLEESAASFFEMVRFEAIEPEIFEQQETFVLKISIDPMDISPGVKLTDINGHLWIDSKTGRPLKMVLVGKAGIMGDRKSQTSLLVDFHYGKVALESAGWKAVSSAMENFKNDRIAAAESAMRKIEKGMSAKILSFRKDE